MAPTGNPHGWHVFACSLPANLNVMIPEESFDPFELVARVEEISLAQLQVSVVGLPSDLREYLCAEVRCCEVEVDLEDGRILRLRTRIIWLGDHESHVNMSLEIIALTARQAGELQAVLNSLCELRRIVDLSDTDRPPKRARSSPYGCTPPSGERCSSPTSHAGESMDYRA